MGTSVVMPNFIVTKELFELMKNAVASFRKSTPEHAKLELILVDDGSPMKDAVLWMKANADIYIRNEKNSGFAITCNNGFKKATGKYIVCANNDIEVYPDWWEAMAQPFDMFGNVGVTGLISYKSREPEGVPIEKWKIKMITEGGQLRDWMQSGGLWMTTKEVLDECGMFDEQFIRGGYEDVDLFLRYRDKYGKKLIMSGMSPFWHKEGATRWNCENNDYINDFGFESKSIETENLARFIKKWNFNPHYKQLWFEREVWRA